MTRAALAALALLLLAAACGKVGPVRPPGPPDAGHPPAAISEPSLHAGRSA